MKVTPDIIRCEFIGTEVKVCRSTHLGNVGISGEVVDETRNTFLVMHDGKRKTVVKDIGIFQFRFPDDTVVEINGRILVGRPEDRLKKSIRRLW
jgi:ribonuclease P protein subunit POP4